MDGNGIGTTAGGSVRAVPHRRAGSWLTHVALGAWTVTITLAWVAGFVPLLVVALWVVCGAPLCRSITVRGPAQITPGTSTADLDAVGRRAAGLREQAFQDPLTGLPKRALLRERLAAELSTPSDSSSSAALILLDLDDFRLVDERFGRPATDAVLVEVAARLRSLLRPGDVAARLGGDEFALLVGAPAGPVLAAKIADRVLEVLAQPFAVGDAGVTLTASIGVALAGRDADASGLMRRADAAMHDAKSAGKNRHHVARPGARRRNVPADSRLERALPSALRNDELTVHFQPIVDLGSGHIRTVEALVRWNHPELGPLSAGAFLEHAEAQGLTVPLGGWVIQQTVRQAARWHRRHPDEAPAVAVNITGSQLTHPTLVEDIALALEMTGLPPKALILEVTEQALQEDPEAAAGALLALRGLGIRIAVDDFGTGYSSLGDLRQFPIDIIKIAKPFVDELHAAARGQRLAEAILGLADVLGVATVAKGVERPNQVDTLRRLGCTGAQGFFFSRALPPAELEALLAAQPFARVSARAS